MLLDSAKSSSVLHSATEILEHLQFEKKRSNSESSSSRRNYLIYSGYHMGTQNHGYKLKIEKFRLQRSSKRSKRSSKTISQFQSSKIFKIFFFSKFSKLKTIKFSQTCLTKNFVNIWETVFPQFLWSFRTCYDIYFWSTHARSCESRDPILKFSFDIFVATW